MAKANLLTALEVKQARKPGVYPDGLGLRLRVEEGGAKRWVLRLTVHGRRRDVGLGSAADVSLLEVRHKADGTQGASCHLWPETRLVSGLRHRVRR